MSPVVKLLIGIAAMVLSAWVFHGPAGYGARLIERLDAQVQPIVAKQELPGVTASFLQSPLSRDLRFSGVANDFQRQRFVEIIQEANIWGLKTVGWAPGSGGAAGARGLPLFVESLIFQIVAFMLGIAAAYGIFGRATRNYA